MGGPYAPSPYQGMAAPGGIAGPGSLAGPPGIVGTLPPGPPPGVSVFPTASPPAAPATPAFGGGPWTPAPTLSPPSAAYAAPAAAPCLQAPLTQSSWYTRIDYFHWNEHMDGTDFVNESGALYTLGYARRIGQERFRIEAFGGDVHYAGYEQDQNGDILSALSSRTNYLGCQGEYDLLYDPPWWSQGTFLVGIGSRFWVRDIQSGVAQNSDYVYGYQETWWTFFPYVGLETKYPMHGMELYSSSKLGVTPMAYNLPTINESPLWPRAGLMAEVELGVRGPHLSLSADFETLGWSQSGVVDGCLQPSSRMYTVGGKLGYTF
jgi:hypothetical protein